VPLRLKTDENMPRRAVTFLRTAGHDVPTAVEEGLAGRPDAEVLARCRSEGRVLITLDLDFADIRRYLPADHAGVILLRPRTDGAEAIAQLLARIQSLIEAEPTTGRLWIVDERRVRIRE
jgi:predicted nuclease of predicted toxin-antitoxin system